MTTMTKNRQEPGHSESMGRRPSQPNVFGLSPLNSSDQPDTNPPNLVGLGGSNAAKPLTSNSANGRPPRDSVWGGNGSRFSSVWNAQSSGSTQNEIASKVGSSALLENSTLDALKSGSASGKENATRSRFLGSLSQTSSSRPAATAGTVTATLDSAAGTLPVRAPTISLNASSSQHNRPDFSNNFRYPISRSQNDPAPQVYTKHDRRPAPDSRQDAEAARPAFVQAPRDTLPFDDLRQLHNTVNASAFARSVPGSRETSLPPSRHGEDFAAEPALFDPARRQSEQSSIAHSIDGSYGLTTGWGANLGNRTDASMVNGDHSWNSHRPGPRTHEHRPSFNDVATAMPIDEDLRLLQNRFNSALRSERKREPATADQTRDGTLSPADYDRAGLPVPDWLIQARLDPSFDVRRGSLTPSNHNLGGTNGHSQASSVSDVAASLQMAQTRRPSQMSSGQVSPSLYGARGYSGWPVNPNLMPSAHPRSHAEQSFAPRDTDSYGDFRRDSAQGRDHATMYGRSLTANGWNLEGLTLQEFRPFAPEQSAQHTLNQFRHPMTPYTMGDQFLPNQGYTSFVPRNPLMLPNAPSYRPRSDSSLHRNDLLSEYKSKKNNNNPRLELRSIFGKVREWASDQQGSRFIQLKLETASSEEKAIVFGEIMAEFMALTTDVFANYVVQKFFEHGDQMQKKELVTAMRGKVLYLTLQVYGCRVVQKALEHVFSDQQKWIVDELRNDALKCMRDQNGNHVIQKAILDCKAEIIPFIFKATETHVMSLSQHTYGCRVIQRCLEKAEPEDKEKILQELFTPMHMLVNETYGNYVVQHVIEHCPEMYRQRALGILLADFEEWSRHKFSSNVVEKAILMGDDKFRRALVAKFDAGRNRYGTDSLVMIFIKDQFANYVIQKLLDALNDEDYLVFVDILKPDLQRVKDIIKTELKNGHESHALAKHLGNIEKRMYRVIGRSEETRTRDEQPPTYERRTSSDERTPPLTASSVSAQTSSVPSINGDCLAGASSSRKGSVQH